MNTTAQCASLIGRIVTGSKLAQILLHKSSFNGSFVSIFIYRKPTICYAPNTRNFYYMQNIAVYDMTQPFFVRCYCCIFALSFISLHSEEVFGRKAHKYIAYKNCCWMLCGFCFFFIFRLQFSFPLQIFFVPPRIWVYSKILTTAEEMFVLCKI